MAHCLLQKKLPLLGAPGVGHPATSTAPYRQRLDAPRGGLTWYDPRRRVRERTLISAILARSRAMLPRRNVSRRMIKPSNVSLVQKSDDATLLVDHNDFSCIVSKHCI
jgi:hypothetical protein